MKKSSRKNTSLRLFLQKKNRKNKTMFYIFRFFVVFTAFLLLSGFYPFENKNYSNFPPDTKDTIFVYDTVVIYDTAYVYDTIYVDEVLSDSLNDSTFVIKRINKQRIYVIKDTLLRVQKNSSNFLPSFFYRFSLSGYFSPIYSKPDFYANTIYNEILNTNNNSLSPLLGYTAGVNLNFHKFNFELSSGLNFTQIKSDFNFMKTSLQIDTSYYYKYFTKTEMKIDTVLFLNLDTLLATGETLWVNVLDTNYITFLDSSIQPKADTTEYLTPEKKINSFNYIEIPFIFGYNIRKRTFSITPEIGIIAGIIMYSQGKIVSLGNIKQSRVISNETKLSNVLISMYAGFGFSYYLSKKIDFTVKAYYRQNINSIFENYPLFFRYKIFGLQFGIKYKFLYSKKPK